METWAWNSISGFIIKGGFSAAARSLFCQFGVFKRRKLPIHLFCVLFHGVWSHVDLLLSDEFFISLYILIQKFLFLLSFSHNEVQIFNMEKLTYFHALVFSQHDIDWMQQYLTFLTKTETVELYILRCLFFLDKGVFLESAICFPNLQKIFHFIILNSKQQIQISG